MAQTIPELLFQEYPRVGEGLLSGFLDCFIQIREHFGGDPDQFIIFMTIAVRTAQDPRTKTISSHAVRRGELTSYPSLLTNVSSIAASSAIPKETVRRKVKALIEKGWVTRREGALALTVEASFAFRSLREDMFRLVESHYVLVNSLLAQREARA